MKDGDLILPSDRVTPRQAKAMVRNSDIPSLGDYGEETVRTATQPSAGAFAPYGPANFPITTTAPKTVGQQLDEIKNQLVAQNTSALPQIRSMLVDTNGQTLDWSQIGLMDRIVIRNKGPQSVWIGFDISGEAVDAFVSDLSYELQSNESLSLSSCQFFKIGCKAASGSGTVHAVAFLAVAGDLGATIS